MSQTNPLIQSGKDLPSLRRLQKCCFFPLNSFPGGIPLIFPIKQFPWQHPTTLLFQPHRQMSTSWSSSGQLHSYISRQLPWLWFINSPSSWTMLSGVSSHIFLNWSTLAASLYTCFARWQSLKVSTQEGRLWWTELEIVTGQEKKIFSKEKKLLDNSVQRKIQLLRTSISVFIINTLDFKQVFLKDFLIV